MENVPLQAYHRSAIGSITDRFPGGLLIGFSPEWQAGLGQISEVFDGDPPHHPGGRIAQAWSVAEVLRTYIEDVKVRRPD